MENWKRANVGVIFDLHHVPLVVDQCLDIAGIPKNIKSGFKTCGIFPFDADVFTEVDFISSELSSGDRCSGSDQEIVDDERSIIVTNATTAHEDVKTPESMTVAGKSGSISSASLTEELRQFGPLKRGTPAKKSNRGRKPMRNAVLTSPEFVTELRQKAEMKRKKPGKEIEKEAKEAPATKKRKTRTQRALRESSDQEDDVDFCILCLEVMPKKLTKNNSVKCIECGRDVHAKCVRTSANTFTCKICESD